MLEKILSTFPKKPMILENIPVPGVAAFELSPNACGQIIRPRAWTSKISGCYNPSVLAYAITAFFSGFALFLLGFSVFMYRENRKFGDNQFTVKLLPPPPRKASTVVEGHARAYLNVSPEFVLEERPERVLSRQA
jgi:hypothetical protein